MCSQFANQAALGNTYIVRSRGEAHRLYALWLAAVTPAMSGTLTSVYRVLVFSCTSRGGYMKNDFPMHRLANACHHAAKTGIDKTPESRPPGISTKCNSNDDEVSQAVRRVTPLRHEGRLAQSLGHQTNLQNWCLQVCQGSFPGYHTPAGLAMGSCYVCIQNTKCRVSSKQRKLGYCFVASLNLFATMLHKLVGAAPS